MSQKKISKSNDMCLHPSKSSICTLSLRILFPKCKGWPETKHRPSCWFETNSVIWTHFHVDIYQDQIIPTLGLVLYQHFINHTCVSWPGSSEAASADNKKPGEASHDNKKTMEERRREQERKRQGGQIQGRCGRSNWSETGASVRRWERRAAAAVQHLALLSTATKQ